MRVSLGIKQLLAHIKQLFARIKQLLSRIYEWYKSRRRRAGIEDYYYSGGEASKNRRARSMDRLFSRVTVFAATALGTHLLVGNFPVGLFFGAGCTYLFHWLAKGRRVRRIQRNRDRIMEKEAVERFLKLAGDKSMGGFFEMVREWLERSSLFSNPEMIKDTEGRPLLIIADFKGQRTGIYAKKLEPEAVVKEKDLEEFVQYCQSRGLENGIYIAGGTFDYSAREYAGDLEAFDLYIADTQAIYRAFIKEGHLFSVEDLQAQLEQRVLEQNLEAQHSLGKILAFRRIKTYAVLSILIAVYSVMVPYTLYYILVSVILLCLSVTALIRWEIERIREDVQNSIRLDNAMEAE